MKKAVSFVLIICLLTVVFVGCQVFRVKYTFEDISFYLDKDFSVGDPQDSILYPIQEYERSDGFVFSVNASTAYESIEEWASIFDNGKYNISKTKVARMDAYCVDEGNWYQYVFFYNGRLYIMETHHKGDDGLVSSDSKKTLDKIVKSIETN